MLENQTDTKPWFHYFWPWFLIAILMTSIASGLTMIYLAVSGQDSLVNDNYYREGLAINQVISQDQKASEMQLAATLDYVPDTRELTIVLNAAEVTASALQVKLVHPTLAGRDQLFSLPRNPIGTATFSGILNTPLSGRWHIEISDSSQDWRLKGEIGLPGVMPVQLTSQ